MPENILDTEIVEMICHLLQIKTVVKPKQIVSHLKKIEYIENEAALGIRIGMLLQVLMKANVLKRYGKHAYIVINKNVDISTLFDIFKKELVFFDGMKAAYPLRFKSDITGD